MHLLIFRNCFGKIMAKIISEKKKLFILMWCWWLLCNFKWEFFFPVICVWSMYDFCFFLFHNIRELFRCRSKRVHFFHSISIPPPRNRLLNGKFDLFSLMLVPGRLFYCLVIPEWVQFFFFVFYFKFISLGSRNYIAYKIITWKFTIEKMNGFNLHKTEERLTDTKYKRQKKNATEKKNNEKLVEKKN